MKLSALLVSLKISRFINQRRDPGTTAEVKVMRALTGDAGRWVKNKLDPLALRPVLTACSRARETHYALTLPWEDGARLLPMGTKDRYQAEMQIRNDYFLEAVNEFAAGYPDHLAAAQLMHGRTFDPSDYPSPENVASVFKFGIEYAPVPETGHFRNFGGMISEGEMNKMKGQLEEATVNRINQAMADAWERILTPVRQIAAKLKDADFTVRKDTLESLRQILAIAPSFNLTGNPQMDEAIKSVSDVLSDSLFIVRPRGLILEELNKVISIGETQTAGLSLADFADDIAPAEYVSARKFA